VDKLSSSLWTSYLSYDVCFVSEDMCVDCACMSKWKQWEIELTCQWGQTQRRWWFTNLCLICSLPPRSRFTAVKSAIRLNYWALRLVMGVKCSLVTDFIARVTYQKFEWFTMCEFSQVFKTFCLNLCATKFDPNFLASHPKFSIK
jgi:hypothetical protein